MNGDPVLINRIARSIGTPDGNGGLAELKPKEQLSTVSGDVP